MIKEKPSYADVVREFEKWIAFEFGEVSLDTYGNSLGMYSDLDTMSMFSGFVEGYYKALEYNTK